MYAFNSAAIFYPGHPYIESTTVLSDNNGQSNVILMASVAKRWQLPLTLLSSPHMHIQGVAHESVQNNVTLGNVCCSLKDVCVG